jgi:hypothetical protein
MYSGEKSVLEKIEDPKVENRYNMTSTNKQYPAPRHSGYVPNMNDPSLTGFTARPFSMYAEGGSLFGNDTRSDMVGHLHKETPLNKIYFSQQNIDFLQSEIQKQVNIMSGGKYNIDRQSEDDIKIIMRSYYLMFGKNDPNFVERELQDLNSRVVGYCSAKIYSEVDFYMFYRNDIADFAAPIANPTNVHVYGSRTGELKSFF